MCISRAHKEILFFASPFFEAALSGNWSETGRPASMSSVVTISQSWPRGTPSNDGSSEPRVVCVDSDADPEALEVRVEFDLPVSAEGGYGDPERTSKERDFSLAKLQGYSEGTPASQSASRSRSSSRRKLSTAEAIIRRNPKHGPDAVIVLKEEKVCRMLFLNTQPSLFSRRTLSMTS